jgi:type IV secretion system protein TrbL
MVLALAAAAFASGATAPPASALDPIKPVCGVAGLVSGLIGKACTAVQNGGRWVKAGQRLLGGHLGGALKTALGQGGSKVGASAATAIGLGAVVTWVLGGARVALHETATILGHTTSPQLRTTWFSETYWRVAGISAVLTMPFLFAAAIQALLRSDLTLLVRAAFGYLPLAMLAVGVAAPVTMLLLAASDQLSAVVSSAAGNASTHFLAESAVVLGGLAVVSPFIALFAGLLVVAGAITLWIELLMREAAVYVIVMMLPLAFAAMVWPARRIWAIRAVELLIALILSKFAIVAVLSLGSAALGASVGNGAHGITAAFAGIVLLVMGAFAPWVLLRLLPLAEIASSAAGSLRSETRAGAGPGLELADGSARAAEDWAVSTTARMRNDAADVAPGPGRGPASETTPRRAAPDGDGQVSASQTTSRAPAPDGDADEGGHQVARGGQEAASRGEPREGALDRPEAEVDSTDTPADATTAGVRSAATVPAVDLTTNGSQAASTLPAAVSAPGSSPTPEPDEGIPAVAQTPERENNDIPVLQEMADPGNEGRWALDLEDAAPPPPDLEPL